MATKHAINVKETESQLSVIQKERQAVFQDAFQNDLNCYKELGTIPSKPTATFRIIFVLKDDAQNAPFKIVRWETISNFLTGAR